MCRYITNRLVVSTNPARPLSPGYEFARIADCWANYDSIQRHEYAEGEIMLIPEGSDQNLSDVENLFHGRSVRSQVDFNLLRSCIQACDEAHGSDCSPYQFKYLTRPSILVDVDLMCIKVVKEGDHLAYAALSYVWGPRTTKQYELNKRTKTRLQVPNGLYNGRVPKTIHDAMTVCSKIGIRYLWVDALCIQQDLSQEEKDKELGKMASIYNNAIVTIVAAAGEDSWEGLPGVHEGTRQRQECVRVNGLLLARAGSDFRRIMEPATWTRRGWTFQERVLSRRLLVFTSEIVFFNCQSDLWIEDTYLEKQAPSILNETETVLPWTEQPFWKKCLNNWSREDPFFDKYAGLVKDYSKRDLSRDTDGLRAFGGLLDVLKQSFDVEFHYGLPVRYLDAALCFSTTWMDLECRRRKSFPTWSWSHWKIDEGVDYDWWYNQESGSYDEPHQEEYITYYRVASREACRIVPVCETRNPQITNEDDVRKVESETTSLLHTLDSIGNDVVSPERLLIFRARCRYLRVVVADETGRYHLIIPDSGKVLGYIRLPDEFGQRQNEDFEFVLMYQEGNCLFLLMLDQFPYGVSSRIQSCVIGRDIPIRDWQERTVFLT